MFDFDVVTGPNAAEILRRKAEADAGKEQPGGLAPAAAAPLSSEPQDHRERGK